MFSVCCCAHFIRNIHRLAGLTAFFSVIVPRFPEVYPFDINKQKTARASCPVKEKYRCSHGHWLKHNSSNYHRAGHALRAFAALRLLMPTR